MDYRQGKCSNCGAEYKIPASFQHNAAKCKECGGVVSIGPVTSGTSGGGSAPSAPVPARQFAGKRAEEEQKKGGTLERLKAQRVAAEPKKPSGTLEKLKAERAAAAAKPAAAALQPVHSHGATVADRSRGSKRRSSASARRRGGEDDGAGGTGGDDGEPTGRRGAHHRPKKQPSMALFGIAVVLLIVGGGAAWWMFAREAESTQAMETGGETAQAPEQGTDAAADSGADAAVDDQTTGTEDAAGGAPADGAEEKPADQPAAEDKPEATPKKGDPDSVDLASIPDFPPIKGTSTAEWDTMAADMTTWMDPWAGKKGNDARDRLLVRGYHAMPVIINGFKKLDLTSDEGYSNGSVVQRAITDLTNGTNFGWKSQTEEDWLYFNKRVIQMYCTQWEKSQEDINYWIKFAKLEEKNPALAAKLREEVAGASGAAVIKPDDDLDID